MYQVSHVGQKNENKNSRIFFIDSIKLLLSVYSVCLGLEDPYNQVDILPELRELANNDGIIWGTKGRIRD